jgi:hypothetical protein
MFFKEITTKNEKKKLLFSLFFCFRQKDLHQRNTASIRASIWHNYYKQQM